MSLLEFDPDSEGSVARGLADLAQSMQDEHGKWAAQLRKFVDRDHQIRLAKAPVAEWYDFARSLDRCFGGMGTLNDIELSVQSKRLRTELFSRVQHMLRRCWKELGRENHDGEVFPLLPVGAEIRFVPGKTMYLVGNESRRIVPEQRWVHEQSWTIENHGYPDITNMPTYGLRQGSKYMVVRCECVSPAV